MTDGKCEGRGVAGDDGVVLFAVDETVGAKVGEVGGFVGIGVGGSQVPRPPLQQTSPAWIIFS